MVEEEHVEEPGDVLLLLLRLRRGLLGGGEEGGGKLRGQTWQGGGEGGRKESEHWPSTCATSAAALSILSRWNCCMDSTRLLNIWGLTQDKAGNGYIGYIIDLFGWDFSFSYWSRSVRLADYLQDL